MKSIYLTVSCIFFFFQTIAYAQDVTVKGRVINAETSEVLEFANVAILSPQDSSLIKGAVSELDGTFSLLLPQGSYLLRVNFIGYENYFRSFQIGDRNPYNLGNIRVRPAATDLGEVVVEGVASIFESDIDKRTYNVENSIVAEGATAAELLSTLPSIQVDEQGGISMRGSGEVMIFINGRPSNLGGGDMESILSQFPANSIKSVELITNPSSRYDAAGVGGIINIILKQNQNLGFNGQVNASVGTRDKYQVGTNLNYATEKVNYFFSLNAQDRQLFREAEGFRENFIPGVSRFLDQDDFELSRRRSAFMRTGFDYNVRDNMVLGFYAQGNTSDGRETEETNQRSLNQLSAIDSIFVRDRAQQQLGRNFETGLNYTWNIDSVGQRLYSSASIAWDSRTQSTGTDQTFFNSINELIPANGLNQLEDMTRESRLAILQLDYEKPIGKNGKLETGLKGTFSNWERGQAFAQGDIGNNFQPSQIDSLSDTFSFTENVYASYFIFKNRINKFGYQVGARAEYTQTEGNLFSNGERYVNDYFNIFPSVYTSYKLGEEEEISANYSRRISRPGIWALSPILNLRDQLNFSVGNPLLQPEFTDSYEVGYMKGFKSYLLNATVYHRYSTDIQTRIVTLLDNNITIQSRENADIRRSTGFELVNQFEFTSWWNVALTGNFFYSEIFGANLGEGFNNSNFSWTVNMLSTMSIPNLFSVQIQGDYRGPIVLPQGQIEPLWGINLGIKRDVLNKKGTISVNVSDIFDTRIFRITTNDSRFDLNRMFNRETRIGTVAFTYRFGGFKDRNGNRERGGRDMGEDMDF
ncbi:outer membrane beta-barrel family protein [Mongoliitalea daihaiensis]|uniref:outer membrane beta-barrel family protein n=1 Tax=Mongoliitalea daihaiensis TaxID=2782006 RepID=UPI001F2CB993|nr:outer membrane beta-barrel family protein [Mongoliitalea daihaiensis]UJP65631.1 TonB-dependent receptor [Mongoliitalea daihaiensis]